MQAIGAFAPKPPAAWRMLDYGSGTGILSIAAAKLGATVVGIDIDESANASATENAVLNAVADRVEFASRLEGSKDSFDVVVANILRRVLFAIADELVEVLATSGTLVLSGLLSTDVPEVSARYASRLQGRRPERYERGEWRALVWRGPR